MSNYDILKAYIFNKNHEIVDKFPDNLDISITDDRYYNTVNIPDNKGDKGNSGKVDFSYDVIEYQKRCNKCPPDYIEQKTKIENINNNEDITISPSININNTLLVKDNITFNDNDITYDNINTLKELLNSDLKCDQGKKLINNTDTSIGECKDCNHNLLNIIYTTNTCDWECDTNYTISPDGDKCLILCSAGYKRNETENTCEPCGSNYYNSDTHTDTDCSDCPSRSTTNDNTTATSITDCTAKPGYERINNSNYNILEGNIINNGELVRCDNYYYYNGHDCQPCSTFGDGIFCNTSIIANSKLTLKSGYGFSDKTSYPCQENEYRNSNININSDDDNIECYTCPPGSIGNNGQNGPNDECTLLPGYNWKTDHSSPPDYDVTLKPGNWDSSSPFTGTIKKCDVNYYFNDNSNQCEYCDDSDDSDGIQCTGGPIEGAKKMLLSGYSTEQFTNFKINKCEGEREYRHDDIEYSDTIPIPCNQCPIGSISDSDNTFCELKNGYEWKTNGSTAPNYDIQLKQGNLDEESPIGEIDGCGNNYYYNGSECINCTTNYDEGITCLGSNTLDGSNRTLEPGYSWDGSTAQPCADNEYRFGEEVIQDNESINCTNCPTGTTYNGSNGCELLTGYSWQNGIHIGDDNLYNIPSKNNEAYYYENDIAKGCISGYYNTGDNECILCPNDDGIECNGNRPFDQANMTLKPNYSWNGTIATKCPKEYKRERNVPIDSSDITCNPCGNKLNNSEYLANGDNTQQYDSSDYCEWRCEQGYELNDDKNKCLKKCSAGEKRNESSNTCEPCGYDNYKSDTNINTSCSPCPTGSTTNENTTASDITDCTARPGYRKEPDNSYTLKQGNLDNNNDGNIDGCAYNYSINSDETECTSCPPISNGGYNVSETPNDCTNIICNPGYKLDNRSCQPCGIDNYKSGLNTDTSCSPCPTGSTTNTNETATAITECTARPGYTGSGNSYTLKPGNLDDYYDYGIIDGCSNDYYYNGHDCQPCSTFGEGVECTGGPIDGSKRILQDGYSWNGSTAEPCGDSEYRFGKEVIQDNIPINCTNCPTGTTGTTGNMCELNTGYIWDVDASDNINDITNNLYNKPLRNNEAYYYQGDVAKGCKNGYYYYGNECVSCSSFGDGVGCPGGLLETQAFRYLKPGYKWNSGSKTSDVCDQYKYRSDKHNVIINDSSIVCTNTCDGNQHVNDYRTGCIDNDGYTYYGKEDFHCSIGYYYSETSGNGECIECGDQRNAIICRGGNENGEKGIKILKEGWEKQNGELNMCAIDYYRQESDYNGENTTCIPCEAGHTTNGETGQSECIEQCSSVDQYYDDTHCPEYSSYDGNKHCICNDGYEVNSANDGCDAIH